MSKYNANVRTGNWYDELMLEGEKTKQYVRKSKNGELKVQKARQLFVALLKEIPLTFPVVGLSYGALIEIISPENPPRAICKLKEKQGIALACHIELENSDRRCKFASGDPVIGSGLLTPCSRNVWTLIPEDRSRKGKELRFGDVFHIQLYDSDPPLYLTALKNGPSVPKGESGHVVPTVKSSMNTGSRFKVVHFLPNMRYETEGTVVPPFEKLSLLQGSTGEALAVEPETWFPTYFGMECEVSVHTFRDLTDPSRPDYRNSWSLILSAP